MKLRGPEPEQPPLPVRPIKAKRGDVDAEERRVFWLAVGVFSAVLLAAFLGNQLFRPKDKVPVDPPVGPRVGPPVDPMTQPLAETVAPKPEASEGATEVPPQPTAAATAAEDTPADPAPALESPADEAAESGRSGQAPEQAGPTPTDSTPTKAKAAVRPPPAKTRARRRPERDGAYIRRLRDQMQQYEREKAQGKYQEPPQ